MKAFLSMTSNFAEFGFAAPLARALAATGYETPTPIQAGAIPHLLAGHDLLGLAQTGTGKTAAFVLPILQALRHAGTQRPTPSTAQALILAPTRELAIQIDQTVKALSKGQSIAHAVVYGGVNINPQIQTLRRGVHVLVATPGRLIDLIQQRCLRLDEVRYFVLDEADRMLDMGFIRDVKRILKLLPAARQSMLFSATMPDAVDGVAASLLRAPKRVEVRTEAVPVDRIVQHVVHAPASAKRSALLGILRDPKVTRAIVFARTKHGANRIGDYLEVQGVEAGVIHGNKSQAARQRALGGFKSGDLRVLIATDIASRGIDVSDISHVINADLPDEPEAYVHRIGRTARAGRTGEAITLCAPDERNKLRAVERLIRLTLKPMTVEGLDLSRAAEPAPRDGRDNGQRSAHGQRRDHAHRNAHRHGQPPAPKPVREKDNRKQDLRLAETRPFRQAAATDASSASHSKGDRPKQDRQQGRGPQGDAGRNAEGRPRRPWRGSRG